MLPVVLRGFVPATLRPIVGEKTFVRGMAYAMDGAVLDATWDNDAFALRGTVAGSNASLYSTIAYFRMQRSQIVFRRGECSCPVAVNCKHAVALVTAAIGRRYVSTTPARAPQPPAWEHVLSAMLPETPPSGSADLPAVALAIELSVSGLTKFQRTSAMSGQRVLARLVRRQKDGWAGAGMSWTGLHGLAQRFSLDHRHVQFCIDMFAVYQAGFGRQYSGYGDERALDLTTFNSPQLWGLLQEAAALGVALVHARPEQGEVAVHASAQLCLDVTAPNGDRRAVTPSVNVADLPDVTPIAFVGSEGHGVVFTDSGGCLHLARMTKPVPDQLRHILLTRQALPVPHDDLNRFATEFYPRLRTFAAVTSSDRSFTPPAITGPVLAVDVTFQSAHSATVAPRWKYSVGESRLEYRPGDNNGDAGIRDQAREQQIIGELRPPVVAAGSIWALLGTCPEIRVDKLDTPSFATEVLPVLESHEDVDLCVTGAVPDFREVNDSVAVRLSTAHIAGESDWFDLNVVITVDNTVVAFPDVFRALNAGESHMILPSGAYFSLEKPEFAALQKLIDEARALDDSPDDTLRINRYQAGLWEELVGLGVVGEQAEEWRRSVDGLLNYQGMAAGVPHTLKAVLRPYQQEGFEWLAFLWSTRLGGILADDMGLGKTVQALALIAYARIQEPHASPFLIVAPTSVITNWVHEAQRFVPDLAVSVLTDTLRRRGQSLAEAVRGADLVVTSYTLFRLDFEEYGPREWAGMLLDEAQIAKNRQAKIYQCCRQLDAPFKLAITGTPIENNVMELWSLLSITAPGLFPNPHDFKEVYANPIEKLHDREMLHQLKRRIAPLVRRRTKELVAADLPPKQEQIVEVDLHPRHRKAYETRLQRERQKVMGLVDDLGRHRMTILQSLTTLRQLSLHAGLVDEAHERIPAAKIDVLIDHLDEVVAGGHRALVFSQFTGFLRLVRKRLESEEVSYAYLDGRTRNRGAVIDRFRSGKDSVFLISLKAGGFGLNLTEADYVFILDPWWNPATEAQAVDRTHRIGQDRQVMVYRLISEGTIEEKVMALKKRKADLFTSVLDEGAAFGDALSAEDIRTLFA
ncbi:DEAD/DEAH box helicase [Hoyosella altamirensis]|uniref:Superfamily II DNA or RNA helicase n=1 Tax=Hoyosella altamirensis TaxID=616997 RepID=A0A839RLM0_9ACTN|nr:DEAD/DEAH box helicase [Hoyosella altamirensis]MBB3037287.1 superfamily II DNA or RNA helicase [Hoyosella altamirensis]